jgi:hypothetical protein
MRVAALLAMFALTTSSFTFLNAQEESNRFSPEGSGFEVTFPQKPVITKSGDSLHESHDATAKHDSGLKISCSYVVPKGTSSDKSLFLEGFDIGNLISDKPLSKKTVKVGDLVAEEVIVKKKDGYYVRSWSVKKGEQRVVLVVVGTDEKSIRSKVAEAFFSSFKAGKK